MGETAFNAIRDWSGDSAQIHGIRLSSMLPPKSAKPLMRTRSSHLVV
jgi:hypothetical protein